MAIIQSCGVTLTAPASTVADPFVFLIRENQFSTGGAGDPLATIATNPKAFANGGGDLQVFSDALCTQRLPCHVISFVTSDTTPEVIVWVRATGYTSGDAIYFGKDDTQTVQPAVGSTYGQYAVYSDYVCKYGLESTSYLDSTSNNLDMTSSTGTPTIVSGGVTGNQLHLDFGDSVYRTGVTALHSKTELTISGWINLTDRAGDRAIITQRDNTGNASGFEFFFDAVSFGTPDINIFNVAVVDSSGNAAVIKSPNNSMSLGLSSVEATFIANSSTGLRLYINGAEVSGSPVSTIGVLNAGNPSSELCIGSVRASARDIAECDIDDVSIKDVADSGIAAAEKYNNQSDPTYINGTLHGYEDFGGGGGVSIPVIMNQLRNQGIS